MVKIVGMNDIIIVGYDLLYKIYYLMCDIIK